MATFRGAQPFDELSPGLKILLISNTVVFLLQMIAPPFILEKVFALHPFQGGTYPFLPWQLVTYSFLHGSGFHLFINMLILWMFGTHIERFWGSQKFLTYYFVCVVGAAIVHLATGTQSPAIGASGGIYGLLLAFGLLFPDSVIYMFFLLPMRAIQAVLLIGLIALASAMSSGGSRIAHFAHLGGMLTGYLYFKFPIWRENFRFLQMERKFKNPKGRRGPNLTKQDDINQEVDRILEKISAQGVESLTSEEHKTMERYAKKKS